VLIQIFIAARQPAFFMADIYEYYVPPTSMEPLLPEENSRDLEDLVGDFLKKSSSLTGRKVLSNLLARAISLRKPQELC
jgi:hypothetical protein